MQPGKPQKPKVRLSRDTASNLRVAKEDETSKPKDVTQLWDELDQAQSAEKPITEELKDVSHSIKQGIKDTAKKTSEYASIQESQGKKSLVVALPKVHNKKHLKKGIYSLLVLMVAAAGVYVVFTVFFKDTTPKDASDSTANSQIKDAIPTNVTPEFPVLTPFGEGVAELGGFAKISPNGAPAVYAYADTIGGVPIKVSQQQLPDSFRSEPTVKLQELASQYNANEQVEVGDAVAYVGTSVKGVQSVVYAKGENLVLIASESIVPNADWVTYIGSLQF